MVGGQRWDHEGVLAEEFGGREGEAGRGVGGVFGYCLSLSDRVVLGGKPASRGFPTLSR